MKKIASIFFSAVFVFMPIAIESVSAQADTAALIQRAKTGNYWQIAPINPPKMQNGFEYVSCSTYYYYAGIAFTCNNIDAVKATAPAEHPVEWSDSLFFRDAPDSFLIQPLTGYAEAFTEFQLITPSYKDDHKAYQVDLSVFADNGKNVYLAASCDANAEALAQWLCGESNADVLGTVYGTVYTESWYDNMPPVMIAVPKEGCTLTAEILGDYGGGPAAEAHPVENSPFGYWKVDLPMNASLEQALTICREVEKNDNVAYAVLEGCNYTNAGVEDIAVVLETSSLPFIATALKGDLDGDGSISAYDASLVLRGANEITAGIEAANRTLTPAQEALGDVDGDSELTAFDASCILRYYNLKYVAEIEGITWADVLPGA